MRYGLLHTVRTSPHESTEPGREVTGPDLVVAVCHTCGCLVSAAMFAVHDRTHGTGTRARAVDRPRSSGR